jgi:cellulose synthase/poly-beta-1,6-N-acetylglucosamine synthase-like glycosyltransferase
VDRRAFAWWDYPVFGILTALNLAAVGLVAWYWVARADVLRHPSLYLLITAPFALGLLIYECRWFALPLMRRPSHTTAPPGLRVGVATTFVPSSEPVEMLERTLRALIAMEYPHDTWVLDEGDDDRVKALCTRLGARHFSRLGRSEYQTPSGPFEAKSKHGNYNAWLAEVGYEEYEIVVGYDPDHVPARGFLLRVLGYFEDPDIGYVQAAQVYYNQGASFVARGAAEETYAYYSSIQMSAYAMGYPIVTGCHNSHRVSALKQVGGFAAHEADDLLITLLYRSAGWRGIYLPETLAVGLVPVDWPGYLGQQRRWARSVLDIKFRIFPRLFGKLPLRERVASLVHGLHYFHGLTTAAGIAAVLYMLATGTGLKVISPTTIPLLIGLGLMLELCEIYRQRFFIDFRSEAGFHWRGGILRYAKWPVVLLASLEAIFNVRPGYVITRKIRGSSQVPELALAHLLTAGTIVAAWLLGWFRGAHQGPVLLTIAALLVAMSLVVCFSTLLRFPDPYDPKLEEAEVPARLSEGPPLPAGQAVVALD